LILFEDDHLLVVNKPPGISTHAVHIYGSAGLFDWLRNREPRWSTLATHQRLDKGTSGVLAFAKSSLANQSLAQQFRLRTLQKTYWLQTDRNPGSLPIRLQSQLPKPATTRTHSLEPNTPGLNAETTFELVDYSAHRWTLRAIPHTGRSHQIRMHAREAGFPILGDTRYGGSPSHRLHLHSHTLTLTHPATLAPIEFRADINFNSTPQTQLRRALWPEFSETQPSPNPTPIHTAWRLVHGASDGFPGWYVERIQKNLRSVADSPLTSDQQAHLMAWIHELNLDGFSHQIRAQTILSPPPTPPATKAEDVAPTLGPHLAPTTHLIHENGVRFWVQLNASPENPLHLDQRDNRRRLLTRHVARNFALIAPEFTDEIAVLDTFPLSDGFSLCAAISGAHITNLRSSSPPDPTAITSFQLNNVDPSQHNLHPCTDIGQSLLHRFHDLTTHYNLILLDASAVAQPPLTCNSTSSPQDWEQLILCALEKLKPQGVIFCSSRDPHLRHDAFLHSIQVAVSKAQRHITQEFFAPQPPDFPTSAVEPGYLKSCWLRIR